MDDGDLTLKIGDATLGGWTDVSVTRGIERMPSSFDISLTEKYPGVASALVVQPGDTCQVLIGQDVVITGYVDRFNPRITSTDHTIRVVGRSKSADLVDCSAEWPGGQIVGSSALQIAQKLAAPYGIDVKGETEVGAAIPQFNLTLGETAYAIIERICRYRGLLVYDNPDGSVALARAGTKKMASGFVDGEKTNCQVIEAAYSMDERFSDYEAFLQSVDTFDDTGDGGNLLAHVKDPGVKRHRQRDIIAEAGGGGMDVAKQRANWEAARRAGRSFRIDLTADSWRASDGELWTPNKLVDLALPSVKLPSASWLIGEVTFRRSAAGTNADLVIMPSAAFLPEPILLQPFPADVPPQ